MKIGIVSDSHGKAKRLTAAVGELISRGTEHIVHCGDFCAPEQVALLRTDGRPASLVAGNMDRAILDDLADAARQAGVAFAPDFITVEFAPDQHLAATHGHLESLLDDLIAGGQFPFVCHGHTHRLRDETLRGGVRVLNPGALRHPRGGHGRTCLLLDTTTGKTEVVRTR